MPYEIDQAEKRSDLKNLVHCDSLKIVNIEYTNRTGVVLAKTY